MWFESIKNNTLTLAVVGSALMSAPWTGTLEASDMSTFYVGTENRPLIAAGTYAGQANPNHNRLTLLYSHVYPMTPTSNHFHRIGAYIYTGPAGSPTVLDTSANNRVPEPSANPGFAKNMSLSKPTSGTFAGDYVSGVLNLHDNDEEYAPIVIRPVDQLFQYDGVVVNPGPPPVFVPGHYLLNTSSGAYKTSLGTTQVQLQLLSITPGLNIALPDGTPILTSLSSTHTIGTGTNWEFTPVFWVDGSTAVGVNYSAEFRLLNAGGSSFGDSARFYFDFTTVPEPTTGLILAGLGGLALLRRRR